MKNFFGFLVLLVSYTAFGQDVAPPVSLGGSAGITGGASLTGENILTHMTDANYTMVPGGWWAGTQIVPSSLTLTAIHTITAPANPGQPYNFCNHSTGGFAVNVGAPSQGSPISVPNGKCINIWFNSADGVYTNNAPVFSPPTGTGFVHIASGVQDSAARAVNLATADVTGLLPNANLANISTNINGTDCLAVPSTPCIISQGSNVAKLWGFGTSILYGVGATTVGTAWFSRLATTTTAPAVNRGAPGSTLEADVYNVFRYYLPEPNSPSAIAFESGENNAGCSTTPCDLHVQNSYMAADGWSVLPQAYKTLASTCTQTGSWSTDGTFPIAQPTLLASSGDNLSSTTNGSTLTCTTAGGSDQVMVFYGVGNSLTGTFTVSIDGVLQTNNGTGTTTFSAAPLITIAGTPVLDYYMQLFTGTGTGTHTVVFTTTNTGESLIAGVGVVPPSGTTATSFVLHAGVISTYSSYTSFNPIAQSVVSALRTAGLSSVIYIDTVSGTPGVNNTTDMSTSATTLCPASLVSGHPNDCGQLNYFRTVINAEAAAGINIGTTNQIGSSITNTGQTLVPLQLGIFPSVSLYSSLGDGASGYLDFNQGGPSYAGGSFIVPTSPGQPWDGHFVQQQFIGAVDGFVCNSYYIGGGIADVNFKPTWCSDVSTGTSYQLGPSTAPLYTSNVGPVIASASTIAPANSIQHVTGTSTISTINPPSPMSSTIGGCITLIADGAWTTATGGNISAVLIAVAGTPYQACYDGSVWYLK